MTTHLQERYQCCSAVLQVCTSILIVCSIAKVLQTDFQCLPQGASRARSVISGLQRGHREFLVAVRREGQFVGEMAAFASAALRCASVRARGPVRAKIVPGELLRACVERVPEVRCSFLAAWSVHKYSQNNLHQSMSERKIGHGACGELVSVHRWPCVPVPFSFAR